jgi:hypothetical protein
MGNKEKYLKLGKRLLTPFSALCPQAAAETLDVFGDNIRYYRVAGSVKTL